MRRFFSSPRNRRDLYHVLAPAALAMLMAPQSFAGAALFILVWGSIRWGGASG